MSEPKLVIPVTKKLYAYARVNDSSKQLRFSGLDSDNEVKDYLSDITNYLSQTESERFECEIVNILFGDETAKLSLSLVASQDYIRRKIVPFLKEIKTKYTQRLEKIIDESRGKSEFYTLHTQVIRNYCEETFLVHLNGILLNSKKA